MGYERHDMVIVYHNDFGGKDGKDVFLPLAEELKARLSAEGGLSQDIIKTHKGINGRSTTVFYPDGSKKGWVTSDKYTAYRQEFIKIARKIEYANVIELSGCLDEDCLSVNYWDGVDEYDASLGPK